MADFTHVIKLAESFSEMGKDLPREVRDSVKKAGQNVKNDTQKAVSTHPRWRILAKSINYDFEGTRFASSVTVGYDKGTGHQGNFGRMAEFGSSKNAPHPALIPAFESEAERFPEFMAAIAVDVARKAL